MSFEEEKLQLALAELKDTERRCANESYKHNTGIYITKFNIKLRSDA